MRRSNWNSGVPRLTWTFGSTSTAVTSVGSDSLGVSWIVRWMTRASVDVGATKRRPMQEDDSEMQHEERREEAPGDGEFQPPELEEHQPDDEAVGEQQDESEQHGCPALAFRPAVRWSAAAPMRREAGLRYPCRFVFGGRRGSPF